MKRNTINFYAQLSVTLLACAFLIVPIVMSVLAGITENYMLGIKSGITFHWIGEVWRLYSDTIFRSIYIALACLLVTLVAGVPAAYFMVVKKSRLTRLLEEFLVIPLAIPGLAIALALLITYGGFRSFRMSWLIILTGHVLFTLPFMIRSVIAVMSSININEMEEGAASLGAKFWHRFFYIVVPNSIPGILAGSLMVFTLSVGEFNLTWMLHTPLTKTLPVGLADSYASMRLEIGSAYTVVFLLMIIPLLVGMQWVAGQERVVKMKAKGGKKELLADSQKDINSNISGTPIKKVVKKFKTGVGVRLVNCAKTFADGTQALLPFDFSIDAGETIVILGPSGCGKTTTLRMIAGLESPDHGGQVFFGDEDVTDVPIESRGVGMVFQSYALFPNMNVAGNIAYGLKVRGDDRGKQEERVNEMLDMMQIDDLKNRRIDQLSGGQKQRVALARALATRPKVLLMDEPLTALDAKLRDTVRVEIDLLLKSLGVTSVYVTHDQAEAMALGDRIVVMNQGSIAQVGTPREIYFNPKNRYVAEFVGSINRIKGVIKRNQLEFSGGSIPLDGAKRVVAEENDTVNIFFRPEHAGIVKKGQGHFAAEVVSSFFLGDRTQLLLKGATSQPIKIEAMGTESFENGQLLDIQIDQSSIITLRE